MIKRAILCYIFFGFFSHLFYSIFEKKNHVNHHHHHHHRRQFRYSQINSSDQFLIHIHIVVNTKKLMYILQVKTIKPIRHKTNI